MWIRWSENDELCRACILDSKSKFELWQQRAGTRFERWWREFKEKPEYQPSPFPFPPKRMTVADKLLQSFLVLAMILGSVRLLYWVIKYYVA